MLLQVAGIADERRGARRFAAVRDRLSLGAYPLQISDWVDWNTFTLDWVKLRACFANDRVTLDQIALAQTLDRVANVNDGVRECNGADLIDYILDLLSGRVRR